MPALLAAPPGKDLSCWRRFLCASALSRALELGRETVRSLLLFCTYSNLHWVPLGLRGWFSSVLDTFSPFLSPRPHLKQCLFLYFLGPNFMVSGTRDSSLPEATLSSVYMWKRLHDYLKPLLNKHICRYPTFLNFLSVFRSQRVLPS